MSDLAFNLTGDAFDVPEVVTGWRVKRLKPRGAPELVYGSDGLPLTVPIDCDMEGLRLAVGGVLSKYRLDAIDDHGKIVEGVDPAYVTVTKVDVIQERDTDRYRKNDGDGLLRDAMRHNTELAKSVIEKFPEMIAAAAELLRAADGAGIPARTPRKVELDEDDDDEEPATPSPALELINNLVAQVVPLLVTGFATKKVPKLSSALDWRKASAEGKAKRDQESIVEDTLVRVDSGETEPSDEALPALDPKAMSHFIAIQAALAPAEATVAREVAGQLSPREMRAWFTELSSLSVPDAVTKIRSFIADAKKTGAVS